MKVSPILLLIGLGSGLFITGQGCSSVTKYDLSSGFVIKLTIPRITWESGGGSRELYYRGKNGKPRLVWEHVGAGFAHNGIAVFIGWSEESNATRGDKYLAVKENGLIVAIDNAVLTRAAQKNRVSVEEYFKRYGKSHGLKAMEDGIQFEYATHGVNQPQFFVTLSWNEISEIVDTVRSTGTRHKDALSGLMYLE